MGVSLPNRLSANSFWSRHLIRQVPVADALLALAATPFVVLAWYVVLDGRSTVHALIAAAVYSVAAAAVLIRRTRVMTSFAVTYGAFGVLVATGSATALGVFPLIACVPLTICAVTNWAPTRWPGWVATGIACLASPLSPAATLSISRAWSIGAHLAVILACYLWSSRRRIMREARARERDRDVDFALLAERQRIAADLHDGLGHSLTAIRAKASTAQAAGTAQPDRAVEALRVISELSKESLVDLRRTLGEMSERGYDERLQTAGSLRDLMMRARNLDVPVAFSFPAHTDIDDVDSRLSSRSRVAVFRAVQESITNIIRHNESGVAVSMAFEFRRPYSKAETLAVRISNEMAPTPTPASDSGRGLEAMAGRIADLGGRCEARVIDSRFVVDLEVPTLRGA